MHAPDSSIAIRKAITLGFRPALNLTGKKFKELDKLIGQFRTTEAGKALITAWKTARTIKGGGQGPTAGGPAPTPKIEQAVGCAKRRTLPHAPRRRAE